jgi:hypothetical protein
MPARTPTKQTSESQIQATPPKVSQTKLARQVYAQVKYRLENEMDGFLENATLEEARFMIEVLNQRSSNTFGVPRGPAEYEIPIYSAIQDQIDCGSACVVVPNQDMISKVEEFIAALETKRWKKPAHNWNATEDEILDRFERSFRSEVELFARDAKRPSFILMRDILSRWNELARDPEIGALPNTLAIAAEMELEKLRAKTAAEAAGRESD